MAIILIAEDRPIDRQLLATLLRTRGHEIVEAADGKEALDALKQISPDLVVSDILMPRLDGYEFVRRMREIPELAATPAIFYTATYHEREALTNVLQHAHATRATVTVRRSRQSLKVAVADNGRGISDRDLASTRSLGLIGMRERTVLLRGTFEARRRQPRGTIVTFMVPLTDSAPGTRAQ